MNMQQTLTNQIDQIRSFDPRSGDLKAELKKLDVLDIIETLENLDLDSLDVFDLRKRLENLDLDSLDVFEIRKALDKIDFPASARPAQNFSEARTQLDDMRAKFESIVKDVADTAAGFAPATRRDIELLEARIEAAEKAAKKAPARKATAKKRPAKKTTARKATAKKAVASK
jgi:hypothetical protein